MSAAISASCDPGSPMTRLDRHIGTCDFPYQQWIRRRHHYLWAVPGEKPIKPEAKCYILTNHASLVVLIYTLCYPDLATPTLEYLVRHRYPHSSIPSLLAISRVPFLYMTPALRLFSCRLS